MQGPCRQGAQSCETRHLAEFPTLSPAPSKVDGLNSSLPVFKPLPPLTLPSIASGVWGY